MKKKNLFSAVLARIRREQGFPSAYKFFKSVGGSRTLGMAFVSYWDIERGKKLPKGWRLTSIVSALGLNRQSPAARELVRAYFTALSGSEELVEMLGGPARPPEESSRELANVAIRQAVANRSVQLSLELWKVRTRDLPTYICSNYLTNTTGWVTLAELASVTGFSPAQVKTSLKALAAVKLAEFDGKKVRSGLGGKVLQLLPHNPESEPVYRAAVKLWEEWFKTCRIVSRTGMTVRLSQANIDAYRPHLEQAVSMSTVYENISENREDTAIYYISGRIYQVIPRQ
jgi:hypothetical protein